MVKEREWLKKGNGYVEGSSQSSFSGSEPSPSPSSPYPQSPPRQSNPPQISRGQSPMQPKIPHPPPQPKIPQSRDPHPDESDTHVLVGVPDEMVTYGGVTFGGNVIEYVGWGWRVTGTDVE